MNFDLKGFRKLGYAIIDVVNDDYEAGNDVYRFILVPVERNVYSYKIKELLNLDLDEDISQDMMEEIYRHKWIESEKVKFDIGMEKAASDWYEKYYKDWIKSKRSEK